jgi:hypothetical protein
MPLSLVKGSYRVLHSEPDGDSLHFVPADPQAFTKLHLPALVHRDGGVQLRLDAIDALETHYTPRVRGGFLQHQPLGLAHAAADELLHLLGFTSWKRERSEMVSAATPTETEGYILTRFADKYGRPVSLAYAGRTRHRDLRPVRVDPGLLAESANFHLVSAGLAYPTFYSQLYPDLRAALVAATAQARAAGTGVWARDVTNSGAKITALGDLRDHLVIMPKLFRRLVDYLALGAGSVRLDGFVAFLATRDDRVIVVPDGHVTGLDNLVQVDGETVRLDQRPEDLVFMEK